MSQAHAWEGPQEADTVDPCPPPLLLRYEVAGEAAPMEPATVRGDESTIKDRRVRPGFDALNAVA